MRDDRFEWDDVKARLNVRRHGIPFEIARRAFDASRFVESYDDDPDETRVKRVAAVDGRLIAVIYTERGTRIRIISARKATTHEQADYEASP